MNNIEQKAKTYAKWYHQGQYRKYTNNSIPYYLHPGAVARLVKTVPHTPEMVAAAWMHDLLEDTDATYEEIWNEFGQTVASYVMWLTDQAKPSDGNRAARKKINRDHIAKAPAEAKTVKLADLIDNSYDILAHDKDFAKVYIPEKRLLLDEALKEGDQTLWGKADSIVKEAWATLGL